MLLLYNLAYVYRYTTAASISMWEEMERSESLYYTSPSHRDERQVARS